MHNNTFWTFLYGNVEVLTNKYGCEQSDGVGIAPDGSFCGECSIKTDEQFCRCCKIHVKEDVFSPCPFCGGTNVSVRETHKIDGVKNVQYTVYCCNCSATAGTRTERNTALESWNVRSN